MSKREREKERDFSYSLYAARFIIDTFNVLACVCLKLVLFHEHVLNTNYKHFKQSGA